MVYPDIFMKVENFLNVSFAILFSGKVIYFLAFISGKEMYLIVVKASGKVWKTSHYKPLRALKFSVSNRSMSLFSLSALHAFAKKLMI